METSLTLKIAKKEMRLCPHSLGTLIEWKQLTDTATFSLFNITSPHSLGTLIEWKLLNFINFCFFHFPCPHSLGTLIEWKQELIEISSFGFRKFGPHSLGTLIEWKPLS